MKVIKTEFGGLFLIYPTLLKDQRGSFFESYKSDIFSSFGISDTFPLEFQSISKKGVIRGLHFQNRPFAQGKLIRVIRGKVLDVVLDLRKKSETYGKWFSFLLDDIENVSIWIPEGFAHGFVSLEDDTTMMYKLTNTYDRASEGGVIWNDSDLGIDWQLERFGIDSPILSDKDLNLKKFKEINNRF